MNKAEYTAWLDRMEEHSFPTPPLEEYLEAQEYDSKVFWRISSGHIQNFLDEAVEIIGLLEERLAACREGRE